MGKLRNRITQPKKLQTIRDNAVVQFDNAADEFDNEYERMSRDYFASAFTYGRHKLDLLLTESLQGLPNGSRVLDVGCGTGEHVAMCRNQGFDLTGIEPSANMRAIALARNPNVPIVDGSILELPFDDESFDFVLAIEVLRYLHRSDIERAYCEMLRVLKPNGIMFFTMINRYALDGFYAYHTVSRMYSRYVRRIEPLHNEFTTPYQIHQVLNTLGACDFKCYGRLFAPIRIIYKINASLGARIARLFESFDNPLAEKEWATKFAGHLVVLATRPENEPMNVRHTRQSAG